MRQWYEGMTLLDALDAFKIPARSYEKPLRAMITSVVKESKSVCDINVKVLQGRMLKGRGIGIGNRFAKSIQNGTEDSSMEGLSLIADVKKIVVDGNVTSTLYAGQNGTISLQ